MRAEIFLAGLELGPLTLLGFEGWAGRSLTSGDGATFWSELGSSSPQGVAGGDVTFSLELGLSTLVGFAEVERPERSLAGGIDSGAGITFLLELGPFILLNFARY